MYIEQSWKKIFFGICLSQYIKKWWEREAKNIEGQCLIHDLWFIFLINQSIGNLKNIPTKKSFSNIIQQQPPSSLPLKMSGDASESSSSGAQEKVTWSITYPFQSIFCYILSLCYSLPSLFPSFYSFLLFPQKEEKGIVRGCFRK